LTGGLFRLPDAAKFFCTLEANLTTIVRHELKNPRSHTPLLRC
jgi:hypothetical protein